MPPRANKNPLPATAGSHLISYILDIEEIQTLQVDIKYNMSNSAAQITTKEAAIVSNLEAQFQAMKSILIENTACSKCGQSPLVPASKHEAFKNPATGAIWTEIVEVVEELKTVPEHIKQVHLDWIKKQLREVEHAYRRDDVAANC